LFIKNNKHRRLSKVIYEDAKLVFFYYHSNHSLLSIWAKNTEKHTCGNSVRRNKTKMTISNLVVLSVLFLLLDAFVRLLILFLVWQILPFKATTRTSPFPVVWTAAIVVIAPLIGWWPVPSKCCEESWLKWLIRRPVAATPSPAVCGVLNLRPSLSLADLSSAL
jgi:hypothetical protein